jgi:acetyl-CoA C-acetyltransferase
VTVVDAYVFEALRTPRGKARPGGGLAGVPAPRLLVHLLRGLAARTGVPPSAVEDLIVGAATQHGEQGGDVARTAALLAGWRATSGMTVNRFCASGVDAVTTGAALIASGMAGLLVAGGVESVSRVPMYADGAPIWRDPEVIAEVGAVQMGTAADLIATLEGFEREELDAYGLRTQVRAAEAWRDGRYGSSVLAVRADSGAVDSGTTTAATPGKPWASGGLDAATPGKPWASGGPDAATSGKSWASGDVHATTSPEGAGDGVVLLDRDEAIRLNTTAESLAALPVLFADAAQDALVRRHHPDVAEIRHLHTAGTSPTLVDAAGLVLLGDADAAGRWGLRPRARIVGAASVAVDPVVMLTGGQAAAQAALKRSGVHPDDVAMFEVAEAFAATCLKFQRDLGIDDERFNPNGGTIAMGHAFGATGPILIAGCVDELERRGERYGVVAVSGAAGVGTAVVLERIS